MSTNCPCPPPYGPIPPIEKKYFYVILFIKSYIYNTKGQAIVFRRKSIESLMKLIYDFDQTYLHTSLQNSFDLKQGCKNNNVDFIVKYDNCLDNVLRLIDQNAYIIKLSWCNNVELPACPCPPPYPPCPPPPCPPPFPPPPCPPPCPGEGKNREYIKILFNEVQKLHDKDQEFAKNIEDMSIKGKQGYQTLSSAITNKKHIRISNIEPSGNITLVYYNQDIGNGLWKNQIITVDQNYTDFIKNYQIGDDCIYDMGENIISSPVDEVYIPSSIIDKVNILKEQIKDI